jgi:hypothetical protein
VVSPRTDDLSAMSTKAGDAEIDQIAELQPDG